jgi:glutamate-1-semialdehyde 2,1-aminomutase
VFIVDEVTSGLRFGFPGGCSTLRVQPDIAVYAKALSNGFPFGVLVGRDEVMSAGEKSFISSSYWTDGIGPAAALATLGKAERIGAQSIVWSNGTVLQQGLRALAERYPGCRLTVGGLPPSTTLTFSLGPDSAKAHSVLVRRMKERGFLFSSPVYIMVAHTPDLIAELLGQLDFVLAEIAAAVDVGAISDLADATAAERGFARLA